MIDHNIFYESSTFVPKPLLKIEQFFEENRNKELTDRKCKVLASLIKDFTGIQEVYVESEKHVFNACVMPVYSNTIIDSLASTISELVLTPERHKKISPDELNKLSHIKENSKGIQTIYIVLGSDLVKILRPKQVMGVLLHELGHVYIHKTTISMWIQDVILTLASKSTLLASILYKAGSIDSILPGVISHIAGMTASICSQMEEREADKFAVKYGYGDDLAAAMGVMGGLTGAKNIDGIFNKIIRFFKSIILTFIYTTHPDSESRAARLNDMVLNAYKDIYPNVSEDTLDKYIKDVNAEIKKITKQ